MGRLGGLGLLGRYETYGQEVFLNGSEESLFGRGILMSLGRASPNHFAF